MMPFPSLSQSLYLLTELSMVLFHCLQNLAFWVALPVCLCCLAYSWHIFWPILHVFWVRFEFVFLALLLILNDFLSSFR